MKIRSPEDLQQRFSDDLAWRLQELTHYKLLLDRQADARQMAMLRGAVTLLYAHWEGFVKTSAGAYLAFVTTTKTRRDQLSDPILAACLWGRLSEVAITHTQTAAIEMIRIVRLKLDEPVGAFGAKVVNTKSNLTFEVLAEILAILEVDAGPFLERSKDINKLVGWRNSIAHGRTVDGLDRDEYLRLSNDVVLVLVRTLADDLLNASLQSRYKRL